MHAVILHNFLIAENDKRNAFFEEDDDCMSNIDANNELNCPVNDAIDEQEQRNELTEYFFIKKCMWCAMN